MANKNLFAAPANTVNVPVADAVNAAGGTAYAFTKEHHLAQIACTGMLGDTFYEDAETQLKTALDLAKVVDSVFVAKLAVYARQEGFMKDMPALLAAVLANRGSEGVALLKKIFPTVIDNGRMLRTFVQIMRSGRVGRRSFGTSVKKIIQNWFDSRSDNQLFRDSVGNDPSLADVIKMVHPRPQNPTRQALYRYLIGKELNAEQAEALPPLVKEFEAFKQTRLIANDAGAKATSPVPNVPFQMLTSLNLTTSDWSQIAQNGNWHFVKMNLNTFARHGVFADRAVAKIIADKLRDRKSILDNKVFPYQLFAAYKNADAEIPSEVRDALHDAMEIAIENVPTFTQDGVIVLVDVSGSMGSPVSVRPDGKPSAVTCLDVAGLFGSAILRKNPGSVVLPFDGNVRTEALIGTNRLSAKDSVLTNAAKLTKFWGGGTDCSAALRYVNQQKIKGNVVIYVSDNMSWIDTKTTNVWDRGGTATMEQWKTFKKGNPNAKMVNINVQPYGTTQASNDKDIVNIGGFSDTIFETIEAFVTAKTGKQWVTVINEVDLNRL